MNSVIWKFPIGFSGGAEMPKGAQFLHFGIARDATKDSESFCVWALVDPKASKIRVDYRVVATGADIADLLELGAIHRGTVIDRGVLVWHLFEVPT